MIKIEICDDEETFVSELEKKINLICTRECIQIKIRKFLDPRELLNSGFEIEDSIVFLDIDMPNINGFELAQKLQEGITKIHIIFVSNRDELVFESLKYHPYFFIRKNYINEELDEQLIQICALMKSTRKQLIPFKSTEGTKLIDIETITHIENNHNYINIHAESGVIVCRKSMNEIEKELFDFGFIRASSGYIVNAKHIYAFTNKQIRLSNNVFVPISRKRQAEIQERITRLILNE